jgi:hypothetical protein
MKLRVELARAALLTVALCPPVLAGRKPPEGPPPLSVEHHHPSGAFTFRTPEGWTVQVPAENPAALEAWGGDLGIRFVYRAGEAGYDALHATCMLERLAGPMDIAPDVSYEYDFISGTSGNRRMLDSAFIVRYDQPRHNHREWRQRNLTVVGDGDSLCLITYVPREVWKGSASTRALVDAVVGSVTFRQP